MNSKLAVVFGMVSLAVVGCGSSGNGTPGASGGSSGKWSAAVSGGTTAADAGSAAGQRDSRGTAGNSAISSGGQAAISSTGTVVGGATGSGGSGSKSEISSGGQGTGGVGTGSVSSSTTGLGGQTGSSGGATASGGSASGGQTWASGGATASGGSAIGGKGGNSSSGGSTSVSPDAGKDDASSTTAYTCNLVFGNSTTQQWFNGGFLTYPGIDATHWELIQVPHHYVGAWASPSDVGWTTAFDGGHACASGSKNPDRVIFIVTQSPPFTTANEYKTNIAAIVNNIKAKYSQIKRIELTTLIRSPGNSATACSSKSGNEQSIPAAEDDGIAAVAADPAFAGLVLALPPFYVTACSDFNPDAPQYTTAGAANIAKVYGAYYTTHP